MSGAGRSHYWTFMRAVLALVMVAALAPFAWYIWHRGSRTNFEDVSSAAGWNPSQRDPVSLEEEGYNDSNLCVDPAQLVRGNGVRNDIAALEYPDFLAAQDVRYLRDHDRLIVVEVNGETRAYPTRILNYHDLVNDTIGGVPVAVIYCPLTASVSVVDRRVADRTLEFGVTNRLLNSNTVFYDTTDYALWSQVGLGAISGPLAGTQLTHINTWRIETFEYFRDRQPMAAVLSDYTGQYHRYQDSPYRGYYFEDQIQYPVAAVDNTMAPKTLVLGVAFPDGHHVAYVLTEAGEELRENGLHVRQNPETRTLEVVAAPEGAAVVRTFYFAWYAFYPDTEIVRR